MRTHNRYKFSLIAVQSVASCFVLAVYILGNDTWLAMTLIVGFFVAGVSIFSNRDNLLFFIRTAFIAWIGLIPALAIYMGGYFAVLQLHVQTREVAFILSIITTLSLFSSQLGIEAGRNLHIRKRGIDFSGNKRITLYSVIAFLILTGTFIALHRGKLIFFSAYASVEQGGLDLPINNLQSVANLLMFFGIVLFYQMKYLNRQKSAMRNIRFLKYALVLAGIYVAFWCEMLRGARMDPLTLIFGSFVLVLLYQKGNLYLTKRMLLYLSIAFFILQLWGVLRGTMHTGTIGSDQLTKIVERLYYGDKKNNMPIYFYQGTMNNLSVSVASTIYAIKEGDLDYRYGGSYVDYIDRTPPSFLYPTRPKSLAWLMSDLYGQGGGGGGYNEMAEAYLNFGILGSLIVPGIISFFISYSFRQFLVNRFNIRSSMLFLSILAVFYRGLLYQTFTFYKTFVTALVLYGILVVIACYVPSRGGRFKGSRLRI